MKKGKLSKEGQRERYRELYAYFRQHGTVKRKKLLEDLNMSASSFYDDLRALQKEGIQVFSPKKGTYELVSSDTDNPSLFGGLDEGILRRWCILQQLSLSGKPMDLKSILRHQRIR